MTSPIEILLAEDNAADVFLIEEALSLTRLNFHMKRAADGETASRMLTEIERQKATLSRPEFTKDIRPRIANPGTQ